MRHFFISHLFVSDSVFLGNVLCIRSVVGISSLKQECILIVFAFHYYTYDVALTIPLIHFRNVSCEFMQVGVEDNISALFLQYTYQVSGQVNTVCC